MREIKFRVFYGGQWYYWGFLDDGNGGIKFVGTPIFQSGALSFREVRHRSNQFTGLRDKNGKEIWEGDILLVPDMYTEHILDDGSGPSVADNHLAPVCFDRGSFGCDIKDSGDFYKRGFISFPMMEYEMAALTNKELEVIGNIYENHELIKESTHE